MRGPGREGAWHWDQRGWVRTRDGKAEPGRRARRTGSAGLAFTSTTLQSHDLICGSESALPGKRTAGGGQSGCSDRPRRRPRWPVQGGDSVSQRCDMEAETIVTDGPWKGEEKEQSEC